MTPSQQQPDPSEQRGAAAVPELLARYLPGATELAVDAQTRLPDGNVADLVLRDGDRVFVAEVKNSSRSAPVAHAALQARRFADQLGAVPLVVVPFMGAAGAEACRDLGVGFVDLSGNAHIEAPGLYVHVEGKPNLFVVRGRPASPFASRSSRITRALLADLGRHWTQNKLAAAVDLDPGFTSRILRRLEDEGFITRAGGRVQVLEPGLLVDAWAEDYQPAREQTDVERILSAGTKDEAFEVTSLGLKAKKGIRKPLAHLLEVTQGDDYAATGTTACQILLGRELTSPALLLVPVPINMMWVEGAKRFYGWREAPFDEADVWLQRAHDTGVFYGTGRDSELTFRRQKLSAPKELGRAGTTGLTYVSWSQAYVDAKNGQDPGPELAASLKTMVLDLVGNEGQGGDRVMPDEDEPE